MTAKKVEEQAAHEVYCFGGHMETGGAEQIILDN
jgi:hypothetical protein